MRETQVPTVTRPQFPHQWNLREPPGAIWGKGDEQHYPAVSPGALSTDGETEARACKCVRLRAGPSCCHQPRLQDFMELSGPSVEGGCFGQSIVQMGKLRPREGEERMSPSPEEVEQGSELCRLEPTCCGAQRHSPWSMWATPMSAHVACPRGFTALLALSVGVMTAPPSSSPGSSLASPRCWVAPFRHSLKMGKPGHRARTWPGRRWEGSHVEGRHEGTGTSVGPGAQPPAHTAASRTVEITQPRLPLQKPPVQHRQRWTSHHAAGLGGREGPAARMPGWEAGKASWRRGFRSYSFEG